MIFRPALAATRTFLSVACVLILLSGRAIAAGNEDDLARGEELLSRRDAASAEAAFRAAVAASPRSARAHADLALALLAQGKEIEEAVVEARRAVELEPKNGEFALRYGVALKTAGRPSEAAGALRNALALLPGQKRPALFLALSYAEAADDRAVAAFEQVLKIDPKDAEIRGRLAGYLWNSGKPEQGNRAMEKALELSHNDAELHAQYGEQLALQGRFETAARELERARGLGDDRYELLVELGDSIWNAGRLEEAQARFEEAVARAPEKLAAQLELGRILFWTGNPKQAIPHLETAVRARPDLGVPSLVLGRAYEATGDLAAAEKCFRAAVGIDGASSVPRIALGQLLAREGKSDEARDEIAAGKDLYDREKKLQFEMGSRHVELNLGWVELHRGRAAEALALFEKLPEASDVLEGRAAALSRLGRHTEAIRLLERACALDPENKTARARLSREYQADSKPR